MHWRYDVFLPLILGLVALAWFGHTTAIDRMARRFVFLVAGTWIATTLCMFCLLVVAIPMSYGDVVSLPVANSLLTVIAIAIVVGLVIVPVSIFLFYSVVRLSRLAGVGVALGAAVVGTYFGPWLVLVLGCILTGECI